MKKIWIGLVENQWRNYGRVRDRIFLGQLLLGNSREIIDSIKFEREVDGKNARKRVNGLAISQWQFVFPRNHGLRGSVTRNGTPLIATVSVNG